MDSKPLTLGVDMQMGLEFEGGLTADERFVQSVIPEHLRRDANCVSFCAKMYCAAHEDPEWAKHKAVDDRGWAIRTAKMLGRMCALYEQEAKKSNRALAV